MNSIVKHNNQVLLLEDNRALSEMMTIFLEHQGYQVDIVHKTEETLSHLTPATKLVILDIIMPDHVGMALCRKIKEDEKTRHIPVMVLSSNNMTKEDLSDLYVGADDYIRKPFEYEELVDHLGVILKRGAIFAQGRVTSHGESVVINELRNIIAQKRVVPFFQPIYMLKPFKLLGYEALCRPDTTSILSNPELLFDAAHQYGAYKEIEQICWQKAITLSAPYLKEEKLFLNCSPYFIEGEAGLRIIHSFMETTPLIPQNTILEITERTAISDYKLFRERIKEYRSYGFQFAIDDVGGGYASLEAIVETRPEVVKIDRHIVSSLQRDDYKKSVVKFIVSFCRENNILSVAEGIETKEEFELIKQLGVDAVQGYYLYEPAPQIWLEQMKCLEL